MKNFILLLKATILFSFFLPNTALFGQCASESNIYSFTYNGIQYEIVKENRTWGEAAACAAERGGYLARIDSMGENTAVFNAATLDAGITISSTVAPDGGGASYLWLGGTDRLAEGTWIWDGTDSGSGDQFWEGTSASTGGTSVGGLYNNWGDEPDDFGSGQDGLGLAITDWPLGTAGQWNDVATSNSLYYVIEYIDQSSIDENNRGSFKIFPNPTNDQIQFQFTEGVIFKKAVIYSVDGKVVLESSSPQVDVRNLESGTYRVMILFEDGKTSTETFVK